MEIQPSTTVEEGEESFGRAVRRLRLARRLTQAELAQRANVSLSALKNLERGGGSSLASVVRVARALGRAEWLDAFAPAEPDFSPMAMLHARAGESRARRARRGERT